jgi:hypothetical protein
MAAILLRSEHRLSAAGSQRIRPRGLHPSLAGSPATHIVRRHPDDRRGPERVINPVALVAISRCGFTAAKEYRVRQRISNIRQTVECQNVPSRTRRDGNRNERAGVVDDDFEEEETDEPDSVAPPDDDYVDDEDPSDEDENVDDEDPSDEDEYVDDEDPSEEDDDVDEDVPSDEDDDVDEDDPSEEDEYVDDDSSDGDVDDDE